MGLQASRATDGDARTAGLQLGDPVRSRAGSALLIAGAAVFVSYYGAAVLERLLPHRWLRRFQRNFGNPGGTLMTRLPGWAMLETIGKRSGQPRRVPVGGRIIGDRFWLVAADPSRAAYLRNIEANPAVRVNVGGRWSSGVARILPDDNPRRRMFRVNPVNGLYIAIAGREHLTVSVDLDGRTSRQA